MEFRPMRHAKQELSKEACERILEGATSGVLAVAGDGAYPYAVPLSYVYDPADGGRILFHSAAAGHKIDAIGRDPKASFCVIGQDDVAPELYTTRFRSVIAFGRVRILDDEEERRAAIELLARRYAPAATREQEAAEIERFWNALCMLELRIEHLSGKEAIELVREHARERSRC